MLLSVRRASKRSLLSLHECLQLKSASLILIGGLWARGTPPKHENIHTHARARAHTHTHTYIFLDFRITVVYTTTVTILTLWYRPLLPPPKDSKRCVTRKRLETTSKSFFQTAELAARNDSVKCVVCVCVRADMRAGWTQVEDSTLSHRAKGIWERERMVYFFTKELD